MESKAADALAPTGNGTDDTTVRVFTLTTTSKNAALPAGWYGEFIRVRPIGAAMRWFLSNSASASVDDTIAPSDTGASAATAGSYLPDNELAERECPYAPVDGKIYIVWKGAAAGVEMQVEKGSGQPYKNT